MARAIKASADSLTGIGGCRDVCFAVSAAAILGQNHTYPLAKRRTLKRRTVANASRCASHSRRIRVTLSRIVWLRAL